MSGNTMDPKEAEAFALFKKSHKESAVLSVKITKLEGEIQGLKIKLEELNESSRA